MFRAPCLGGKLFFFKGRELIITEVKAIVILEKKGRIHFWDFWSTGNFLCLDLGVAL